MVDLIIQKIQNLESAKDPKCYATASRLEDFMFGTPLSDDARGLKIDIQKEVSLYIRREASLAAKAQELDSISRNHVLHIVDSLAYVGTLKDGDLFCAIDSGYLRLTLIDLQHYTSVAYSYRALLSLEQDLLFSDYESLLPLSHGAAEVLNYFLNVTSLAALKVADGLARQESRHEVTADHLQKGWIQVLSGPKRQALLSFEYPMLEKKESNDDDLLIKKIIAQKLSAYEAYNDVSTSIFLRNVQVYFARQKWPTDQKESDELKNYFIESLVAFCGELIRLAKGLANDRGQPLVRLSDVQVALQRFLPHSINYLEDVTFFPESPERITIEAYDLDAFRDGGLHWRILDYAISEMNEASDLDPHAAELVVEGVAQLAVLVLRLAGESSHEKNRPILVHDDLLAGFNLVQEKISSYQDKKSEEVQPESIHSSSDEEITGIFVDVTQESGLDFYHKSSDWLNRLIRSYVVSEEEGVIKMAVPPAFSGSGVAAEDLNNDELIDILILGGMGNKLFLNQGEGRFADVSTGSGLNFWSENRKSFGEARQPVIVDFDNDGFQDILITYVDDVHLIYRNVDGTHFEDVSHLANLGGLQEVGGPATALDYDNDGLLDLYIGYFGNYLKGVLPTLSRRNKNGTPNKLFRNMGGFVFQEVPFTQDTLSDRGWTQAVGHADIDQDGRQDIIVGNDFGVNAYYLNTPDRGFVDVSKEFGTDKPSYTMNIGIGDLNRDLHPDFYISNIVVMQKDEKYVNPNEDTEIKFDPEKMPNIRTVEANDLFLSEVRDGKINRYHLSDKVGTGLSSTGWSWDADFFDFDNDGDEDLYCLNGMNDFRVYSMEGTYYAPDSDSALGVVQFAESTREKNVFFVNNNGILNNMATKLGADLHSNSRSASYLDYDNDGDMDIVINNYHDRAVFLRNDVSNGNSWLSIKLSGEPDEGVNRDAIGSSMVVSAEGHLPQWREVHSTTGYLSVHPKRQHFGLGTATQADILIKWSNGEEVRIGPLDANHNYTVQYPDKVIKME